jgi:two-component system CheB/CheR fusion protein
MVGNGSDNDQGSDSLMIVGIGASAGGIQALKEFFEQVTSDSGMAYVVILHLSPDHDSKLTEVLQIVAKIPVIQVVGKVQVEADNIYVISPNNHLVMFDGHIHASENLQVEDRRAPVDIFFRTLAESHGSRAVCVVLSGTGANGSMGLKRIKEKGGAAFVQNPRQAEFSEMPRNSIATGLVDEVLPVSEIPAKILQYKNGVGHVHIHIDDDEKHGDQQNALREIFTQIRVQLGHDFSNYKRPTILRRIERRINVHNLPDLHSYLRFIEQNPEEIKALLKDLLISVTNFFRDQKAFEQLELEVVPALIKLHQDGKPIRIWVAGCATGEEAYSIAMICAEQTLNRIDIPKVQIFGTDIDEDAIILAREGVYSINDAADVSPDRLGRFFTKEGEKYRINPEIREMVLFATHNFIKDPPFSHLDLVSCRNVLIYLNRTAQQRVMETFHFALDAERFLFLGSSESIEGAGDLYSVFNRDHHVFQSRAVAPRSYPVPDSVPSFRYELINQSEFRKERDKKMMSSLTFGDLHQRILEEYAPPSILINQEFEILHVSESAGRYLQIAGGELSQNILKLILPELRIELHSAISQALQKKIPVEARKQKIFIGNREEIINIRVRPVLRGGNSTQGFILLIFEPVAPGEGPEAFVTLADEPVAKHLDEELMRVKAQLRNSVEQHEFRAEELKANNEELQAMNEELRSAAEELETSKEELQSINEELRTVNQELKIKIDETILNNNNLHNLINSSDIGTIFLDTKFSIAFFTPAVTQIFNLIPGDRGRPLTDITSRLEYRNLLDDAKMVLDKLRPIEKEVTTTDQRKYLLRVLPYRTSEDKVNGVVITLVDITARSKAEMDFHQSEDRLHTVTDLVPDLLWSNEPDGKLYWFNKRWNDYTGEYLNLGSIQMAFSAWTSIIHPADIRHINENWQESLKEGKILETQLRLKRADGVYRWHLLRTVPLTGDDGKVVSWFGSATDIDQLKIAEKALSASEERYRIALQSAEMIAWDWDIVTDELIWNESKNSFAKNNGSDKKSALLELYVRPEDRDILLAGLQKSVDNAGLFQAEFRVLTDEPSEIIWLSAYGRTVSLQNGKATRMAGVIYNITNRKILENQKDEFFGIASHELKTPVTSIKAYAEVLQEMAVETQHSDSASVVVKLNRQVDRLTSLINNLLDTTKIFEGQLTIQREEFNINELISERAEDMQPLTRKNTITVGLDPEIPNVLADKERIRQVLTNLISNAIKYSPAGGEIYIQSELNEKELKVSVKDSGIGIPDTLKTKVFDRFFRVKNPRVHSFPGMGLGLYITAGIIHQHGGRILVDDKQETGTLIYFTLPLSTSN